MIKLFTDTSANLPTELINKYAVSILRFSYTVNGREDDHCEGCEFNGPEFYSAMRGGANVKTSMINPDYAAAEFEKYLKNGHDIIYVGMSGGISGTAAAVASAADELRHKYPERKIASIDTYAASLGEGMLVIKAAELLREGLAFNDIVSCILNERSQMRQYFTVDDLKYLKRGGRISGSTAAVGTLLNIKPVLKADEAGRIVACGRVRGRRASLNALAEKYALLADDKKSDVSIAHADAPEAAELLVSMLKKAGLRGNVLTVCYEPVTGSHVGPGAVALFFRGKAEKQ